MSKAIIIKPGQVMRQRDGSVLITGWHMDCRSIRHACIDIKKGKLFLGGWSIEELADLPMRAADAISS